MPSRYWAGAAALAAVVVLAAMWFGRTAPVAAPLAVDYDVGTSNATITVHVAGEVVSPGLVAVPADGRVADAVAASGGSTRDADLARLNLAAPLRDGEQIVVPSISEGASGTGAVEADGRIHINRATPTELEQLPGVGPVLATRIAAHRDDNGPFSAVEDLLDVPGIGEGKLAALRDAVALP